MNPCSPWFEPSWYWLFRDFCFACIVLDVIGIAVACLIGTRFDILGRIFDR